jgi:hypothetical protein
MNIDEIISIGFEKKYINNKNATALYLSAGTDSAALSFLNPGFIKERNISDYIAPEFFMYVDVKYDKSISNLFNYCDNETEINTEWHQEVIWDGSLSYLSGIKYKSKKYGERKVLILFVAIKNREVLPKLKKENWIPHTFIGVCDGCCMGGNHDGCVNTLEPSPITMTMPKYWVTDHFSILGRGMMGSFDTYAANLPNPIPVGEEVTSPNKNYIYKFKKIALLSSSWGGYAKHHPQLGGATLFKVIS